MIKKWEVEDGNEIEIKIQIEIDCVRKKLKWKP